MKKMLFFFRLALYLLAISIPLIHPAIVVPYDRIGIFFWFVLLPVEILIAYFFSPPRFRLQSWLFMILAPAALFTLFVSGFNLNTLIYLAGAGAAVLSTLLIFKWGIVFLGLVEQLFLGFMYYKLVNFTRSSESVSLASQGLTQILLVLLICTFLLYGLVLYFSAFHQRQKRDRRELFLFLALAVPAVLAVALLLPPDFVNHNVVLNRINKDIEPQRVPLDERGQGIEDGNLSPENPLNPQSGNGENGMDPQEGQSGEEGSSQLEGIPADQWDQGNEGQAGEGQANKQYAVMVVASPVEPLYAAGEYFGQFDPVQGFQTSSEDSLNELSGRRLLETWTDDDILGDKERKSVEIFALSTLPERYLAYRPYAVEPTILDPKYHPFAFSFNTVSRISSGNKYDWMNLRDLSESERTELKGYLDIPLAPSIRDAFNRHLQQAVGESTGYYDRIEKILKSFSTFQYELGFNDRVHTEKMADFLTSTRTGDCTEFSNSAAILSRLAGIPARVVTGYLVSKQLQTPVHLQGLFMLRQTVEPLQQFPLDQLTLVTTAHRHSWIQLYLPEFGWVDFETTEYALPPPPGNDLNALDVVIPLIEEQQLYDPGLDIPWRTIILVVFTAAGAAIVFLYLYRYGRELYLAGLSRGQGERALRGLLTLLLMKLSVNGYPLKPISQTPLEYAQIHPELRAFADLYTRLRFGEMTSAEQDRLRKQLRSEYNILMSHPRRGLKPGLKRIFSLKGLYYGWSLYWG